MKDPGNLENIHMTNAESNLQFGSSSSTVSWLHLKFLAPKDSGKQVEGGASALGPKTENAL